VAKFFNSPKAEKAIRKEKQLAKGIYHVFKFSHPHNHNTIFNLHETLNILKLETSISLTNPKKKIDLTQDN